MAQLSDLPQQNSWAHSDADAFAQGATSGVSWGAIFAGAAGACALSLILVLLGVGLGMSSVSPWTGQGAGAAAIGIAAIVWITFVQIASSGMGGYLAGRLRTRWISVHSDEVYFRDTAHGFLAWAVSTLVTATLLASTIGTILGGGVQAGVMAAGTASISTGPATEKRTEGSRGSDAGHPEDSSGRYAYFIDSLFRRDPSATAVPVTTGGSTTSTPGNPERVTRDDRAEADHIFANSFQAETLSTDDARYLAQLVAQRTGLSPQEAEKRVTDTFTRAQTSRKEAEAKARAAVDTARKSAAYSTLWLFISLLIGAFVASLSATYGGRRRDL